MNVTPLSLHSEPYGSTGNIGENFRRLLGAPTLDPLQTVIREAVQNIADAATLGQGPEILIRIRTLSRQQRDILAELVLSEFPAEAESARGLAACIDSEDAVVLEICDFGTVGLGGPTRSDRIPVGTERTDFINFLRNIGIPRGAEQGGGTYGFGKVALYRASSCSTIIVDTLPHGRGDGGRRVMACHVGRSFEVPENGMLRRFTGRHWWGVRDAADGIADPLTGLAATELSGLLGLPERSKDRTGTSIMILGFRADEVDLVATGNRVIETLLWNFWPRMMRELPDSRRFRCRVMVEDRELTIPAPEELPPFDLFSKAMRAARSREGNDVRSIKSQRPARFLGTLAMEKGLRSPRRHLVETEERLVPDQLSHIALMRPVELIVKYLKGNPYPDPQLEWAGVFLASDEPDIEHAFADSEPPAHDDWIPDNLPKGHSKTFVNVALRRLRDVANEMGLDRTSNSSPGGNSGPALAQVADRLGAMLEGVGGDGAGRRRPRNGGTRHRPQRARASKPVFVRLENTGIMRTAVFRTEVTQDSRRTGAKLIASAAISVEGAGLGAADSKLPKPTVVLIRHVAAEKSVDGASFHLDGQEGEFEIQVKVPEGCAVIADAEILPIDPS